MPPNNAQQAPPDIHAILRTLAQSHSGGSSRGDSGGSVGPIAETGQGCDAAHVTPEPKIPSKAAAAPLKDPSIITAWAPALRHVTALIATDGSVIPRLQKLRRSQADHERQWWEGRKALVDMQANRGSGRKQIEAILKGVGGSIDPAVQGLTPEDDAVELKRYDAKVYRALTQMHEAMSSELKALGIPFFCTKPALIEEPIKSNAADSSVSKQDQTLLSQDDLKRLQLRMVETLEDLSGV